MTTPESLMQIKRQQDRLFEMQTFCPAQKPYLNSYEPGDSRESFAESIGR